MATLTLLVWAWIGFSLLVVPVWLLARFIGRCVASFRRANADVQWARSYGEALLRQNRPQP